MKTTSVLVLFALALGASSSFAEPDSSDKTPAQAVRREIFRCHSQPKVEEMTMISSADYYLKAVVDWDGDNGKGEVVIVQDVGNFASPKTELRARASFKVHFDSTDYEERLRGKGQDSNEFLLNLDSEFSDLYEEKSYVKVNGKKFVFVACIKEKKTEENR